MAYNSTHTGQQIDSILDNVNQNAIVDLIYPVGSIYMSVNNTSPATLFGGTWARIQDTFLLMAGNTYTAGSTGGSATMAHTHSQVAGTTGGPSTNTSGSTTLTVDQMPSHRHYIAQRQQWYNSDVVTSANTGSIYSWKSGTGGTTSAGYKGANGDDISHTGGGQGHTHTLSSHTHSISATTTGGASNTDNMPPYLVVYCWKRTA